MQVHDFPEYTVKINAAGDRLVEAKDGSFHLLFRRSDGFTAKWGTRPEDDPPFCPWGNEIADIEITTACNGIRGKDGARKPCAFCFPGNTSITMADGSRKDISKIEVGDRVLSFHDGRLVENTVMEVYCRDYDGKLIGGFANYVDRRREPGYHVLPYATPEHPFMVRNGNGYEEVKAEDLKYMMEEELLFDNNQDGYVSEIDTMEFKGKVYNFHCEPDSMYFADGVLVHNCMPAGSKVTMADGSMKAIEDVAVGDKVVSTRLSKRNGAVENDVMETYVRDYSGELIVLEMENGAVLRLTPNHKVLLRDGRRVEAGLLSGDEDLIVEEELARCYSCEKILTGNRYKHRYCSRHCKESKHGKCLICGKDTGFKRGKFCKECVIVEPGLSVHPLMNTWRTMLYRCYNPKRNKHEFYADNGITVCERWHSFVNFVLDMGEKPGRGYTLDRIDNSKGYSPENCRWATQREQKLNRGRFRNSSRKYKGVIKQGDKFVASIRVNSNSIYLGSYSTEKEAAMAYDRALLSNGGNHSHCNILKEK